MTEYTRDGCSIKTKETAREMDLVLVNENLMCPTTPVEFLLQQDWIKRMLGKIDVCGIQPNGRSLLVLSQCARLNFSVENRGQSHNPRLHR